MDILIVALVVTGIAVLAGIVFGLRALALAKTHPQSRSLNLIAFNLLEPSVTLATMFAGFMLAGGTSAATDESIFLLPVLAFIPFTWMLLAPLWTKIPHPIRQTLIAYGLSRWLNTVVGWYFGFRALTESSSNDLAMLAATLIVVGTLILCANVAHFASSLSEFQIKATVRPAGS